MIEINLLPPEYRPVERTPLPRRLTIFVGVLMGCVSAAVCAWLMFVKVPNARTERNSAEQEAQKKEVEANEVLAKEALIKGFEARANVLRELYDERIPWAKLLDRLTEARNKVDSDDGNGVVLTSLELKRGPAAGPALGGKRREMLQLVIKGCVPCFEAEPSADKLRNAYLRFVNALRADKEFADNFEGDPLLPGDRIDKSLPAAASAASRGNDQDLPKAKLEFQVIFTFKPPEPAAKKAAAGNP